MSLKRASQLPAFNGIPASGVGGTATLDVPRGPRYKSITLKVKDSANAVLNVIVSAIRINVNGKTQRDISITAATAAGGLTPIINMLDDVNGLNSDPAYQLFDQDATWNTAPARSIVTPATAKYQMFKNAGNETLITIFFAEPWRAPGVGGALAWPTGNVGTFQIEVDVRTTAGTVTMSAYAEVDKAVLTVQGLEQSLPMRDIVKWVRTTVPVTGTTVNWTNFPRRKGILQSVHFFDTSITRLEIKADSYVWRDLYQTENQFMLSTNGMTPSANRFDAVLDYDDVPEGSGLTLDAIQDLQFNLTLSDGTARNIPVLIELLGPVD